MGRMFADGEGALDFFYEQHGGWLDNDPRKSAKSV